MCEAYGGAGLELCGAMDGAGVACADGWFENLVGEPACSLVELWLICESCWSEGSGASFMRHGWLRQSLYSLSLSEAGLDSFVGGCCGASGEPLGGVGFALL